MLTLRKFIGRFIPPGIKFRIKRTMANRQRRWLAPRMLLGYKDASGSWRNRTRISSSVFIYHPERVFIEDNVFIWHYTILDGTGVLEIGEGSQIGAWVGLFTHSSHIAIRIYGNHYHEVAEAEKEGYPIKPVKIGRYVFIAAGAKVMPGVTIGDGALISANSVVKENVEPYTIVVGDPGKVIGDTRRLDQRYLTDPQIKKWYNEWQEA